MIWLLLFLPCLSWAGILNIRSGLGTANLKDRETRESVRYTTLLLETYYRTPSVDFVLNLPLRWDIKTMEFDDTVWDRKGDFLKPLQLLRYRSDNDHSSGGFEVFTDWTPGLGYLVRNLSGRGEIDYVLPGMRFRWSDSNIDLDAGMDRAIDPTVQAAAITWRAFKGFSLVLEGALDPDAPVAFSGVSSDGRPSADDSERLSAEALGFYYELVEGNVLDLGIGAHAGRFNNDAKGLGGDLRVTLDFSSYYSNQLRLMIRSVNCEGGYLPAWFDAAYALHRWGLESQPFLALNPLDGTSPDRTMMSYDIEYGLGDSFTISGRLDKLSDDSFRRARFDARLGEENGRGLELSIWSRADNADIKLFSEEANLHSRLSALYNFLPHFLVNFSYQHSWAFREEEADFIPLDSILLGVAYDISL